MKVYGPQYTTDSETQRVFEIVDNKVHGKDLYYFSLVGVKCLSLRSPSSSLKKFQLSRISPGPRIEPVNDRHTLTLEELVVSWHCPFTIVVENVLHFFIDKRFMDLVSKHIFHELFTLRGKGVKRTLRTVSQERFVVRWLIVMEEWLTNCLPPVSCTKKPLMIHYSLVFGVTWYTMI